MVCGCCFRMAAGSRDTGQRRDNKRRIIDDAQDGDIENALEAGVIILGGELEVVLCTRAT
jgi:hypothetical protein